MEDKLKRKLAQPSRIYASLKSSDKERETYEHVFSFLFKRFHFLFHDYSFLSNPVNPVNPVQNPLLLSVCLRG